MARTVTAIPATKRRYTGQALDQPTIRKVAGYARVSTDHEDQVTSYQAQVDYYTRYIASHAGWQLVDVYTDEGITGTNTKQREGFKTMIAHALDGKIDLIITKSVSRFARNTVDSLTTVRKLKDAGVEVYFEKENIWTFDAKGELLITIMSSLAQEEARSISENVTWGHRKRFADGKVTVPFSSLLGYDKGEDGNLVINPDQAVTVRLIYRLFLEGKSMAGIKRHLEKHGHTTAQGRTTWTITGIRNILTNEKYKGDALLQKTYIADFLTKKQVKNQGEIPQYYVTGNHEPIIAPQVWDFVQTELADVRKGRRSSSRTREFSGKIKCGHCGAWYGSKTWHAGTKYEKRIWRCNHKYSQAEKCPTPHLTDQQIKDTFSQALHQLAAQTQATVDVDALVLARLDTRELETQESLLAAQIETAAAELDKLIATNSRQPLDQDEYNKRFQTLADHHTNLLNQHQDVAGQITDRQSRRAAYEHYKTQLADLKTGHDATYTPFRWHTLLGHAEVDENGTITYAFRDGKRLGLLA
ncbi:recombinase family protein [Trueperella bialowiezensis]|uniref:Transposon Tn3 resolvase n=1 Tax=Trueperella bialowiezensis TaxID=312285 RepID=A0A448PFX9_9ACTO|nr:recombinase family protein [Trueperella bialowiezensis]VEI13835.1 Transposon Tn3 resolvase [Trueperella bialowiezensis]